MHSSMRSLWVRWLTMHARSVYRPPSTVLERNTRLDALIRSRKRFCASSSPSAQSARPRSQSPPDQRQSNFFRKKRPAHGPSLCSGVLLLFSTSNKHTDQSKGRSFLFSTQRWHRYPAKERSFFRQAAHFFDTIFLWPRRPPRKMIEAGTPPRQNVPGHMDPGGLYNAASRSA